MTGLKDLLRINIRRDRMVLMWWILGLAVLGVYFMTAIEELTGGTQDYEAIALMLQDPALRLFTGPGYGLDQLNSERFFAAEYWLYLLIPTALMSIFLMTRHTRSEEQTGRTEILLSTVVSRNAPLAAAVIHVTLANVLLGVLLSASAIWVVGFSVQGSILIGLGTTGVGLVFAGVTAVLSQLFENSRSVSAAASIVLLLAFFARGFGDILELHGSALSWTSPLGWAQQTAPYVLNRFWPLLFLGVLAMGLAIASFIMANSRDVGAALWKPRLGKSSAPAWLGTPVGMALRLQRDTLIGWGSAIVLWALMMFGFVDLMRQSQQDLPEIFELMFPSDYLIESYVALSATTTGIVAAAAAVSGVSKMRTEELSARAEYTLTLPLGRKTWLQSHFAVIGIGFSVILALAGTISGGLVVLQLEDGRWFGVVLAAVCQHVISLWLMLGLLGLFFGWLPVAITWIGWVIVGYGVLVELLGEMLNLPQWLMNFSLFTAAAEIPVEEFEVLPLLLALLAALILSAAGIIGWTRRDLQAQ